MGARSKTAVGIAVVLAFSGLAGPVAADAGTYRCTVLAGTHISTSDEFVRASATSPAGGAGECELATLQSPSSVDSIDAFEGCQVFADTDEDAFVEEAVDTSAVYDAGTSLLAFCEVGVMMAENAITLSDA